MYVSGVVRYQGGIGAKQALPGEHRRLDADVRPVTFGTVRVHLQGEAKDLVMGDGRRES